jgi:L-threonylcarbamoyladenylate synthase
MNTLLLLTNEIQRAADLIKRGKLVAFPTETVYGLGASIFNAQAVELIFKVKGRPSDNPLIAHVHSLSQVEEIAVEIPQIFYRLAEKFFPGPLAIVLKKHPSVPLIASAGLDSIAVRMPSHPVALTLIELTGTPLVAPSANLSGYPSSTTAEHVMEDFRGKIAAVIDGGSCQVGIESTVISLLGPRPVLLRPGLITQEEIEEVLGMAIETAGSSHAGPLLSPGMRYRHYAPKTPLFVFVSEEALEQHIQLNPNNSHRMVLSAKPLAADSCVLCAEQLYARLREADRKSCDEILIYCDAEVVQNTALMNRITKAATR